MDAFEQVVAEILQHQGYWVWPSYWVTLEPEDRAIVGHNVARVNIDVLAYRAQRGDEPPELLVVECKSFLDSTGVQYRSFEPDGPDSNLYKLFTRDAWRDIVVNRLHEQLRAQGLIGPNELLGTLCLACGKIRAGDQDRLAQHFQDREWKLWGPDWLHDRLVEMTNSRYHNSVAMIVAKIMHRQGAA
ncbi:hypothetical protein GAY33_26310 [Azospirillum brasilense]|uniref:hypothetical protein n=1 Tax=Azospirillum argentinense TaxID=2970906 RepID=UPI00190E6105|nr:hypothetical protein [Azospirillum argentinense]MBK3802678.1 hypothetical protein [Azospirillum argentinense]